MQQRPGSSTPAARLVWAVWIISADDEFSWPLNGLQQSLTLVNKSRSGLKQVTCMQHLLLHLLARLFPSGKCIEFDHEECDINKECFCKRVGKSKWGCKYEYKHKGTKCRGSKGDCDVPDYCECLQLLTPSWQNFSCCSITNLTQHWVVL